MQKITPFLWFEKDLNGIIDFYKSVFPGLEVLTTSQFSDTPSGGVETASIKIFGQQFDLMTAGPQFKFTEAISFVVNCETQEEVDELWNKLTADGGAESQCGWLKDKFGLSWQIVPKALGELMGDP
ncbi:MAG: VOC family protein, partial [Candidatus Magasanikbacteria bacterium]|nr:VOC family protein [Candidatus Magasanikbacteria bacterium]